MTGFWSRLLRRNEPVTPGRIPDVIGNSASATPEPSPTPVATLPAEPLPAPVVDPAPAAQLTPLALARELTSEHPGGVSVDVLFSRAEAAGLDVQKVDAQLDRLAEEAARTIVKVDVKKVEVVDLTALDSVRLRIKGSAYCVTVAERSRFGASEYLLVRDPTNEHDPNAIGVFGKGRRVGFISAARAKTLAPVLDAMPGDAYRVKGEGTSRASSRMWVEVPKADALRRFAN